MAQKVSFFLTLTALGLVVAAQTQTQDLDMDTYELQFQGASNGTNRIYSVGGTGPGTWFIKSQFDHLILDAGENTNNKRQIRFQVGGVEHMRLSTLGDFGIGVTNPAARLDVAGDGKFTTAVKVESGNKKVKMETSNDHAQLLFSRSTNGDYVHWIEDNDDTGDPSLKYRSRHHHHFFSNATEVLRIQSDGNLGIGTTAPGAKLDVAGDAKFTTMAEVISGNKKLKMQTSGDHAQLVFSRRSNGDYVHWIEDNDDAGTPALRYQSRTHHIFTTNGGELLRIQNDGKVGIGTTAPDAELTVDGTIHSEEVKVDLSVPGPDYVFAPDYDLRSLEETSTYIAENQHLPEIPSAKEMEANGIDLGVMNMKLLQKIEELTLYQIELLERLKKAESEIAELKTKR